MSEHNQFPPNRACLLHTSSLLVCFWCRGHAGCMQVTRRAVLTLNGAAALMVFSVVKLSSPLE